MTEIGVGTGCFYRLDMSQAERIKFIQGLDVDGVEVTLSESDELEDLDWNRISELVESFSFVTMHSPIKVDFDSNNEDLIRRIEEFREEIGAETAVFHPDRVENIELLDNIEASIENMQSRKGFDRQDLEKFLQDGFPVVVDTVHADTWENNGFPDEKQHLLEKYDERISHVHTSVNGLEEEHEPFCENPERIKSLKNLINGRRIVLESKFSSKSQAKKEVKILRDNLD
jgi:hypothetical protein